MQALWKRAGSAHRCGCRTCNTAFHSASKRTSVGRRKPTFAEVFTACYSSMFATAAIIDTLRKDERRRELDQKLAEARNNLRNVRQASHDAPSIGSADVEYQGDELNFHQMDSLWTSLKRICKDRAFFNDALQFAPVSASELIESLQIEHFGCPPMETLTARRRMNYDHLEISMLSEESSRSISLMEAQTAGQLRTDSKAMETLVRHLLARAKADKSPSPAYEDTQELLRQGFPKYTFSSINRDVAREDMIRLNREVRSIISTPNLNLKEKVGRVCYNLLVSPHPPSIHTMNTMILAFNRAGEHRMAGRVIRSFFFERLEKPTLSTYTAILNNFQCRNDHINFLWTISCVAGVDKKRGAKVRRRHIEDVAQWPTLLKWASDDKRRTRTGDWVYDHAPLSLPLLEQIITGLLHFRMFSHAAYFFLRCLKVGVRLSTRLIRQILDECVSGLNVGVALQLIRGLAQSQNELMKLLLHYGCDETILHVSDRVKVLMELSGCRLPGETDFTESCRRWQVPKDEVSKMLATLANLGSSTSIMQTTRHHDATYAARTRILRIEGLGRELDLVRKITASIENHLLFYELTPRVRSSMALLIGDIALEKSAQLQLDYQHSLIRSLDSNSVSLGNYSLDSTRLNVVVNEVPCHEAETIREGLLTRPGKRGNSDDSNEQFLDSSEAALSTGKRRASNGMLETSLHHSELPQRRKGKVSFLLPAPHCSISYGLTTGQSKHMRY